MPELVEGLLVSQISFLDPSFFAARRPHTNKAAILHVLEHDEPFSVVHQAGLVVNGGHAITKRSIRNRYVHEIRLIRTATTAAGERHQEEQYPKEGMHRENP